MSDCVLEHEKPQHARHGYERVESVDPRDGANRPGAWVDLDERPTVAERTCTIPGCSRPFRARGWCATHWWRWRHHGDPEYQPSPPIKACLVAGCDRAHVGRGMCIVHIARERRTGSTEKFTWATPEMAFHSKTVKSDDGCWLWTGSRNNHGYGRYGDWYMHRWAYEHFVGPIPAGNEVMHSCDNPPCVNPAHLSVGTHADNMRDFAEKGRYYLVRGLEPPT